ncbi:leucine-rich repeat domain-containing protein [Sphingobacterium sp. 2149]|uniref:leucine-rich repeat domain-containing protein n=1 Tax=Sphingobacterium sp. 2149 TaxID=2817763 RepID=UPI001AEAA49D|nr:hypothetical protein [Sphingobacterium sp. 2149]MDR6735578.1 Leucine-rich repeat (LRR) protein [Sphingobacterium sp. 2149]
MKKYIIVFSLSLLTLSVSAQKKKKKEVPPPKVEVPPVVEKVPDAGYENIMVAPMPARDFTNIKAKTITGKDISFNDVKELQQADLSEIRELSFNTFTAGKVLESSILQHVVNEANQLESLTVENFTLTDFPAPKNSNQSLKKLKLTQNKLAALPADFSNFTALEDFSSTNPLTALPESFAQLKKLQVLGLDNTLFTTFPKEIFSLHNLNFLYISGQYKNRMKVSTLPDLFGQLPQLKELGIEHAELTTLPKSIATLKNLEKAHFSFNKFTSFPAALYNIPKLEYVPFTNNPLQWEEFLTSVKNIKWSGLFFINETGLNKKQYEQVQQILSKTDVYYDGMNE